MPSRIIKETIIISESLTAISAEAERFFWRLVVKADDFGLYYGDPRILASLCFPQKPPSEQKIRSWLNELVREDMVGTYTAHEDGKKYLKLLNWGKCQQTRAKSSKYPEPSSFDSKCKQANGNQMLANVSVVTYSRISPNRTSPRNHKIDTITIHCNVGQWTAKQGCDYFATTGRECSANYVVGKDGSIGLSVEEKDRSWCSSSRSNDHRAITIEVASDTKHPYKVTDQALAALIDLLVDICRRNGIKALLWKGDKSLIGQVDKQNMTVHRWFANKACPGDYLYNLHPQIAAQVNERLGAAAPAEPEKKPSQTPSGTTFAPYLVRITASVLNIRKGPGTSYAVAGQIKDRGVYTIVEQKGNWGRLKSGTGWISLSYTKKV